MPALPTKAITQMISTPALEHLPEAVAPNIQLITNQGAVETFVGVDGVNDIYLIDVTDGLGPADVLQNWDVGEDMIVIVNANSPAVAVISDGVPTVAYQSVAVARVPDASVSEIDAMLHLYSSDPFGWLT